MARTMERDVQQPGTLAESDLNGLTPAAIRALTREGRFRGSNTKAAPGFTQATFIAFPRELALDFMIFCQRNPAPAPIIEVTEPGNPLVQRVAPGADLRTDLPRYRVYENGQLVASPYDAREYWRDDMVGFLIGCSCTFEFLLQSSGVRLRHIEEGQLGTIYLTNIDTEPAGPFAGPLAVSYRPIKWQQVSRVVQLSSRFPAFHGAPVHIGDPAQIGITEPDKPWYGDVPNQREDEVGVYWACSVTPQVVARKAGMSFITNEPGSMFLTDMPMHEMAVIL